MAHTINFAANVFIALLVFRWAVESFIAEWHETPWFGKIRQITNPLLDFCRRTVPPVQGVDLSYLVAIFGVRILVWIFLQIL